MKRNEKPQKERSGIYKEAKKEKAQIGSEKREPKRKWVGTRKEETLTICTSKVGHKKGKRKKGAKLTINAIWKIAGVSKLRMSTLQGKGQEVEMARLR